MKVLPKRLMVPRMPMEGADSTKAIGRRLRALREVKGLSQDKIADIVGMASKSASWNGYERGKNAIPAHHALALCRIYNVTMDWIYRGIPLGMPYELLKELEAWEATQKPSPNQQRR